MRDKVLTEEFKEMFFKAVVKKYSEMMGGGYDIPEECRLANRIKTSIEEDYLTRSKGRAVTLESGDNELEYETRKLELMAGRIALYLANHEQEDYNYFKHTATFSTESQTLGASSLSAKLGWKNKNIKLPDYNSDTKDQYKSAFGRIFFDEVNEESKKDFVAKEAAVNEAISQKMIDNGVTKNDCKNQPSVDLKNKPVFPPNLSNASNKVVVYRKDDVMPFEDDVLSNNVSPRSSDKLGRGQNSLKK